ncbi:MAG: NAD(P)-dependent oxidoreductase [Alphaproteobacteria bacterium]|nr:NAD(P)-dependent oxidoreductase [Alphaproteobacteria bacterium]
MTETVIAFLWPEADFRAAGVPAPDGAAMRFAFAGDRAAVEAACEGAACIVIPSGAGRIDGALLALAPALRLVQLTGSGFDNIDRVACHERGVPVAHVPAVNAPAVAQLVVQLALRLKRPLTFLGAGGEAEWARARQANLGGEELDGRIGVIGFGTIGRFVARNFVGLGLEVVRAAHRGQHDPAIPALALEQLIETSALIVLALPATPATRHLIDGAKLALMAPGTVLINVGRGSVVDEAAVAAALASGRLGGAAFDVFAIQPLSPGHPYLRLAPAARARLLLTPHIGAQTRQTKARTFVIALDNVHRVLTGAPPLNQIPPP